MTCDRTLFGKATIHRLVLLVGSLLAFGRNVLQCNLITLNLIRVSKFMQIHGFHCTTMKVEKGCYRKGVRYTGTLHCINRTAQYRGLP